MLCNRAQRVSKTGWCIIVFASVLFLAACGGGGGGGVAISTPAETQQPEQPQPAQPQQPQPAQAEKVAFGAIIVADGNEVSMVMSLDAVAGNDESYVVLRQKVTTTVAIGAVPSMPIAFFVVTIFEPRTVYNTRDPLVTLGTGEVVLRSDVLPEPVDNNPPAGNAATAAARPGTPANPGQ